MATAVNEDQRPVSAELPQVERGLADAARAALDRVRDGAGRDEGRQLAQRCRGIDVARWRKSAALSVLIGTGATAFGSRARREPVTMMVSAS
ncbi:MAG: hypothetical protein ACK5SX_12425 [Sandaracinobacter sp.]